MVSRRQLFSSCWLTFVVALAACPSSDLEAQPAAPGVPDGFFASGEIAGPVRAVVAQPDGKVVIGGGFTNVSGFPTLRVARLNPDGSVDTTFYAGIAGGGGAAQPSVDALAVQPDGKILIGGQFSSVDGTIRNNVARLNIDGSLDTSFSSDHQGPNAKVNALALQPDGRILIGGRFNRVGDAARGRLARLNVDGSLDRGFAEGRAGAEATVSDIALQPDGKVLVAGYFRKFNSSEKTNRSRIARVNSDGSLDLGFAEGLSGAGGKTSALALQSDGKVVVGGDFSTMNGLARANIARLNENGTIDSAFAPGLSGANDEVAAAIVQDDGKLLLGGKFTSVHSSAMHRLARLDASGALDAHFIGEPGADAYVSAFGRQADGKILVAGDFTRINGVPRQRVARLGPDLPDTERPTIELLGENPLSVIPGSVFSDPGALVTDNVDSPRVITGAGLVDTSTPGTYSLVYVASDAAGNQATPVTRTVIVAPAGEYTWDFVYELRHVGEAAADTYLHSSVNARKYSEWQSPPVTYWGPTQNGAEGRVTFRFPLGGDAQRVSVHAELASFNFDWGRRNGWFGWGTGSSSLWASKDGQSWVLVKDNPAPPERVDSYVAFDGDLPVSLLGSNEIWLQVRMLVEGALNSSYTTAQFARSTAAEVQPVLALRAKYSRTETDIVEIPADDGSLVSASTLDIGSYVLENFGKTFQPGLFAGGGLFVPAKGPLPIKVNGFGQSPDSVDAYLPVSEGSPIEFDFGPRGVNSFSFRAGGPTLTAIWDPSRIFPIYILTAFSQRGDTYRFASSGGMAIRASRGAIRKVSIATSYVRTLPAIIPVGGIQLQPAIVTMSSTIEGGVSSLSAVPASSPSPETPRISLVGDNVLTVPLGAAFSDPGALVKSGSDPDRAVLATGTVNTAVAGSYTLTYEATDSSLAAAAPVTRVVNVVGPPAPQLVLLDVVSRRVVVSGPSRRNVVLLLANNSMETVQGSVRIDSDSDSVTVPRELPFTARGKQRDTAPPRMTRLSLPLSVMGEGGSESTVTLRYGDLVSRFTVARK